jgi:hypothetical protein
MNEKNPADDIERTEPFDQNGLEAWTERRPPFDCILGFCRALGCPGGPDLGGASHGRGAARYRWVLRGEGLAVQWLWFADEHMPETVEHLNATMGDSWRAGLYPMAVDLGYHAATPMHADQEPMGQECDLLGLPSCYYGGSSLAADPGVELLGTDGEQAVWAWLEDYWLDTFADLMQNS